MKKFYLLVLASFVLSTLAVQAQENLINGGSMEAEDADHWSVSNLENAASSETSYEFGYTGASPITGEGGALHIMATNQQDGGSHLMFYQAVTLTGGKEYIFDLAAKSLQGMMNSWFEVFLGTDEPQDGADYGSGQLALGGFKSSNWTAECDDLFDGTLQEIGCLEGSQGSFIVEGEGEQTFFIGFKVGIWDYATTIEFVVDNVSLVEVGTSSSELIAKNVDIKLFPNPASSYISVQSDVNFDAVRIINMNGKEQKHLYNGNGQVDISYLKPGVFVVELLDGNKAVAQSQFIKK